MNQPLINILIRVSRPTTYQRCIDSVKQQTYSNIRVIEHEDWGAAGLENHRYNLYCNTLKSQVIDGWFFYLDDDDYLTNPNVLTNLSEYLTDDVDGLVVQFLRNGKPKPSNALIAAGRIEKGRIGGGCLILHSRHKDVADWEAKEAADYDWISKVAEKVQLKFVPLVLQVAGNNGLKGRAK